MPQFFNSENADTIKFILLLILNGIAYYRLFKSPVGFIPILGQYMFIVKIADRYNSPYRKKYIVLAIASFFSLLLGILIISVTLFSIAVTAGAGELGATILAIGIWGLITIVVILGISVALIYYTYKIIKPLVQDALNNDEVTLITIIFAIFAFAFDLFVIFKADDINNNFRGNEEHFDDKSNYYDNSDVINRDDIFGENDNHQNNSDDVVVIDEKDVDTYDPYNTNNKY